MSLMLTGGNLRGKKKRFTLNESCPKRTRDSRINRGKGIRINRRGYHKYGFYRRGDPIKNFKRTIDGIQE